MKIGRFTDLTPACLTDAKRERSQRVYRMMVHTGYSAARCPWGSARGVVTLTATARALAVGYCGSCRRCCLPPLLRRLGAELAECLPGNQMTLRVEGVVDGGVGGEETLR